MLFDKGSYSEDNTFSISELFSHIPRDVLSANFGCEESGFDVIPEKEVYIVDGGDPGTIESQTVVSPYGVVPNTFKHELINVKPITSEGGSIRILQYYIQGNKWTIRGTYKFVGFGSADTKDITQLFNIIESGFFLFFHMDTSFRGGRISEMSNKYKVENIISNSSKIIFNHSSKRVIELVFCCVL